MYTNSLYIQIIIYIEVVGSQVCQVSTWQDIILEKFLRKQ